MNHRDHRDSHHSTSNNPNSMSMSTSADPNQGHAHHAQQRGIGAGAGAEASSSLINRNNYTPIGAIEGSQPQPQYAPAYAPPYFHDYGPAMPMSRHNYYNYSVPYPQQPMYAHQQPFMSAAPYMTAPMSGGHHVHNSHSHPNTSRKESLKESLENFRSADPRAYREWYIKFQEAKRHGWPVPPVPYVPSGPSTMHRPPRSGRSSVNASYSQSQTDMWNDSLYMNMSNMSMLDNSGLRTGTRPPIDMVTTTNLPSDNYEEEQEQVSLQSFSIQSDRQTPLKYPSDKGLLGPFGIFGRGNCGSKLLLVDGAKIRFKGLEGLIRDDLEWVKLVKEFPLGPVKRSTHHKSTITQFCLKKIKEIEDQLSTSNPDEDNENDLDHDYENSGDLKNLVLIWEIVLLLVKQNGSVIGSDLSELLLSKIGGENEQEEIEQEQAQLPPKINSNKNPLATFQSHLLHGSPTQALTHAINHKLWGHALYLSHTLGSTTFKNTLTKFASTEIPETSIMNTFYTLYGNNNTTSKLTLDLDLQDSQSWIRHLCMILANVDSDNNIENSAVKVLQDLKSQLSNANIHYGSQLVSICMEILDIRSKSEPEGESILIGLNPSKTNKIYAYQLSEIFYNYALNRKINSLEWVMEEWEYLIDYVWVIYGARSEVVQNYLEGIGKTIVAIGAEESSSNGLLLESIKNSVIQMIENLDMDVENKPWVQELKGTMKSQGQGHLESDNQSQIGQFQQQKLQSESHSMQNHHDHYDTDRQPSYSSTEHIHTEHGHITQCQSAESIPSHQGQEHLNHNQNLPINDNYEYEKHSTMNGGLDVAGNQGYVVPEYGRQGQCKEQDYQGQGSYDAGVGYQEEPYGNGPLQFGQQQHLDQQFGQQQELNQQFGQQQQWNKPSSNERDQDLNLQQFNNTNPIGLSTQESHESIENSNVNPGTAIGMTMNGGNAQQYSSNTSGMGMSMPYTPSNVPFTPMYYGNDVGSSNSNTNVPTMMPLMPQTPMPMQMQYMQQPGNLDNSNPNPMDMSSQNQHQDGMGTQSSESLSLANPKPKDSKQQKSDSKSEPQKSSWLKSLPFFSSTSTGSTTSGKGDPKSKKPTPMKLPDDKNPTIVWDKDQNRWVDVNEDSDKDGGKMGMQLPPKDSELNNNTKMPIPGQMPIVGLPQMSSQINSKPNKMPPHNMPMSMQPPPGLQNPNPMQTQHQQQQPPPQIPNAMSNKYSLGKKGRGPLRAGYVDVFKTGGTQPQGDSQQQTQQMTTQPSMPQPYLQQQQFFVPSQPQAMNE